MHQSQNKNENTNKDTKDLGNEGIEVAKLTKNGRKGAVRNRIQFYNPKVKRWVKMDTKKGRIISVKSDKKPYKGITKKR